MEVKLWPSRLAETTLVDCPRCGRTLQAKRLQYAHVCKGTQAERNAQVAERAVQGFQKRINPMVRALDAMLGVPRAPFALF